MTLCCTVSRSNRGNGRVCLAPEPPHGQDRAPCCDAAADFLPVRDHGFARAPSAEGAKKHRRTPTEDSHVAGFKPLQAGVTNAKAFPDGRTRSGAGSEELGRTTEEWTTASKLKQSAGSQQKVSTEIVNLPKLAKTKQPWNRCLRVVFLQQWAYALASDDTERAVMAMPSKDVLFTLYKTGNTWQNSADIFKYMLEPAFLLGRGVQIAPVAGIHVSLRITTRSWRETLIN
ncbi:hypothetical protein P8C59_004531 [Phyllachora maydis]|uniref:Uncharacterized protein n=1 Tax=Phyllachora maydis TaxID=1825666 RepID=A0AAD9MDK8_9PEZI|nr:hypothetical protein P8C59_004531 [Phyllachora maydis]